jgi:membrane-associated protease RseP (regulator of RpoE activity)
LNPFSQQNQSDAAAQQLESPAARSPKLWLHSVLFACTLITTTLAGALQSGVDPLHNPRQMMAGLPFALTLMTILLVHEMGHYFTARYHGVRATLPYFLPAPSFIGTFGAFIKMDSPPPDRRSLFDVGASGPLAGLILAIPAVIVGLKLSTVSLEQSTGGQLTLGSSILMSFLSKVTLGYLPEEVHIVLHPIAFAGWIGLLVTALNLLPIGQLDGGHVTYALFGKYHIWVSRLALGGILALGLTRLWDGWMIWGLLLLFMGVRHPPPSNSSVGLDLKRKLAGWMMLGILAVTFIPVPFAIQEPSLREEILTPRPSAAPLQAINHEGQRDNLGG